MAEWWNGEGGKIDLPVDERQGAVKE